MTTTYRIVNPEIDEKGADPLMADCGCAWVFECSECCGSPYCNNPEEHIIGWDAFLQRRCEMHDRELRAVYQQNAMMRTRHPGMHVDYKCPCGGYRYVGQPNGLAGTILAEGDFESGLTRVYEAAADAARKQRGQLTLLG